MKNNTQLKTFTAPKGINSIKSGVFFAIALIAGNIIFTIVALILDFLSEPLRLVFALITSIAMIVYIYIEHYYDFTYGHKLNHRNLNNGNSNLFLIFRSQGTFALVLILLLYTIRTIVIFQEIDTLVPLSNNTVTLDNPPNLINPNNFHVTNINQDISYGGPCIYILI